ncbi:hypothetical protein A4X13_0g1411 [Tilletia indica]|uniref:Uncharacterized protein n=1 Tax=Tilletia indica TaxID=43049 RepID=A0A177TQJ1_9BASI|nr:hypothetical protein A4X13_0g1411 [Tilletia indica]
MAAARNVQINLAELDDEEGVRPGQQRMQHKDHDWEGGGTRHYMDPIYLGYEPQPGDEILHVPSTISPEELWENFISKRRPVIIDGFPTDPEWQAHKWADLEHLRTLAGHATVKVEPIHPSFGHFGTGTTRKHTTFGEFLDVLQDPAEAGKWYLTTQYDSESGADSDGEDESDEESHSDSDEADLDSAPLSPEAKAARDDTAPQSKAKGAANRKRKRDSEAASAVLSPENGVPKSEEDIDEAEGADEDDDDSEELLSVILSDSDEAPDLDDVLPSPTHALVTEFPAQPKLMGGLILQQCNLWLGSSGIVQQNGTDSAQSGKAKQISHSPTTLPGKSSGLHHDFHDNLYALLSGQKRLLLFPPTAHRYLHPRGTVLRVHKNGLIIYEPRDHEIDRAVVENLVDSDSGYRSDDPDLEMLSFLRANERAHGKLRNLSIRPDGLTPLDAAKWRIRARARALALANERAAAETGEHRVHRDRRKGKGRQTKEQEEALLLLQEAKGKYALQKLIEETNDGDDDEIFSNDYASLISDINSDVHGNWDDEPMAQDEQQGFPELDIERLLNGRAEEEDDDEMDSDDLNGDAGENDDGSLDLMEDIFEQQKVAIMAAREKAETEEDRARETLRLRVLVERRQAVLEGREAASRERQRRVPGGDEDEELGRFDTEDEVSTTTNESESASPQSKEPVAPQPRQPKQKRKAQAARKELDKDDDDDSGGWGSGSDEDPEGWMMFDELEKEKRAREDAEEEGDSEEDSEGGVDEEDEEEDDSEDEGDDDGEEDDDDDEEDDDDDEEESEEEDSTAFEKASAGGHTNGSSSRRSVKVIKLTKPKPEVKAKATAESCGLVDYSDQEDAAEAEKGEDSNTTDQETELARALRLNGVDDSELAKTDVEAKSRGAAKRINGSKFGSKEEVDEDEDEDEDEDTEGDEFFDDDPDFKRMLAETEESEALLAELEMAQERDEPGLDRLPDFDDDIRRGRDANEKKDDSKEPSSFSLIKPHVLHAYYGFRSSTVPGETGPPASDAGSNGKKKKSGSKKGSKKGRKGDTDEFSIPDDELVPRAGCPRPLVADLKPGQCLYLPASWWHEVTSMSTPEHPFHCALNFWFHPPTNLVKTDEPQTKPKGKKGKGAAKAREEVDGRSSGGSAAAGGGSGAQSGTAAQGPSSANPYEDPEVWDEVRRTVANLVRRARRSFEARVRARSSDGEDGTALDSGSTATLAKESKRRRQG